MMVRNGDWRSPVRERCTGAGTLFVSLLVLLPAAGCGGMDAAPFDGPWSTSPVEETRPLFTEDIPPEEFAERRERVYDEIGPSAFAILQGAAAPSGFIRIRQTNEFYYLSGIESPHAYLVLDGAARRTIVYLPNRDERREFNEGKLLSADDAELVKELAGVDAVHSTAVLVEHLSERARSGTFRSVYTPFAPPEGAAMTRRMMERARADAAADPMDETRARHDRFIERLRDVAAGLAVEDLTPTLDRLRWIKSPRELELIRASTRLNGLGILAAMQATEPGVTEYELEAIGKYLFWRHGAQADAYHALVHVGANAYMNHYHAGVRAAEPGDMILYDYGTDYRYYTSDVTRMWPADGQFNAVQRELYGFYLAVYEEILHAIAPGLTAQDVRRDALVEIDRIVDEWPFSRPEYEAAARSFVESIHRDADHPTLRLGHWVGMAVHDPGVEGDTLRPGLVFVIEPQFRVPEERIYVRLEDMIAITEDGAEVLSDFVPRDIESIERLVGQGGMLLDYPRLIDERGRFLDGAAPVARRSP